MVRYIGLAIASCLAASATPACAQAVDITRISFTPGSISGTVHSSRFNGDLDVGRLEYTGSYVGSGTALDTFSFNIDLLNFVNVGNVDYRYAVVPISAIAGMSTAKRNALNALLTNAAQLLTAATGQNAINISAATQMAVWEVMFETQPAWSVSSPTGAFYLTVPGTSSGSNAVAFATAQTLANTYLGDVAAGRWTANSAYQLKAFTSSTAQTQIFIESAIPEPTTWCMMLLGFGGIGQVLRRGKRQPASVRPERCKLHAASSI